MIHRRGAGTLPGSGSGLRDDGRHGLGRAAALKRAFARGEFVQNQAERELVGLRGEIRSPRACSGSYRRWCRRCARSGKVQGRWCGWRRRETISGRGFRQTEIENLDAAIARDQNVVGLQVAMNDTGGVGGGESLAHLYRDVEQFARRVDRR